MSDYVITPANVVLNNSVTQIVKVAAEAIDAGEVVYLSSSQAYLADASAQASAAVFGIAMNSAGAGQPVSISPDGSQIDFGAIFTVGVPIFLSATAGKICPYADLVSTDYVTFLGIPTTTNLVTLAITAGGVALA